MIDIKRILCPIDFSQFSARALHYAVALAGWYEARVTALHVYTEWPTFGMLPSLEGSAASSLRREAASHEAVLQHMRAFVDRHAKGEVRIDVSVRESPNLHREILAQAETLPADLLVVGSHGSEGFERLLLGSITEKLLRKARCPVMVVPPHVGGVEPAHVVHLKHILCPVDFSDGSLAAVTLALSLAEEADAHLTLLHVEDILRDLQALAEHTAPGEVDIDALRAASRATCLRRLLALVPDSVRTFCTVDTEVADGRASHAILRAAADRGSDLIVMGVQGRGAVNMALFGSNTHDVIRAATCPVLTIRGA